MDYNASACQWCQWWNKNATSAPDSPGAINIKQPQQNPTFSAGEIKRPFSPSIDLDDEDEPALKPKPKPLLEPEPELPKEIPGSQAGPICKLKKPKTSPNPRTRTLDNLWEQDCNLCDGQAGEMRVEAAECRKITEQVSTKEECITMCLLCEEYCSGVNYKETSKMKVCQAFKTVPGQGAPTFQPNPGAVYTTIRCVPNPPATSVGCGRPNVEPHLTPRQRIVCGYDATPHSWPWQIRFYIKKGNKYDLCGGILIRVKDNDERSDAILTAAHCAYNTKNFNTTTNRFELADVMYPVAGHHNVKEYPAGLQRSISREIIPHESYRVGQVKNTVHDIALVITETPFVFSDTVRPLCLPDRNAAFDGKPCVVTGWGRNETKCRSDILQQHVISGIPDDECKKHWESVTGYTQEAQFCAGDGKDVAWGDSGGLFQCKDGDVWKLYGINSFGDPTTDEGIPSGFVRVIYYLDWIANTIQTHSRVFQGLV